MIIVYCDGGSLNNQDKDERTAYGSVLIEPLNLIFEFEYGNFTNNEAEYFTFIKALQKILSKDLNDNVTIRTDSKLVVNQVTNKWKCRHEHLRVLLKEARDLLKRTQEVLGITITIEWVSNKIIKSKLGH
ncbi:MAG: ribonuclease HI family protein [Candidatus Hodarchaeales archaeon]|jgi:probable phosphoglycerate mutase